MVHLTMVLNCGRQPQYNGILSLRTGIATAFVTVFCQNITAIVTTTAI